MRLRVMLFVAILVSCAALGRSQPVSCIEDGECREGYFCETSVYVCHECLSCQDLKREPLRSPLTCIKSIRECGPCLKGLVEDRQGELTCVVPTAGASAGDGNTTAWVIAGITIAIIFIVAVAVIFIRYICRNSFIKFNVDTNIDATLSGHVVATAPESPPPYSPAQNKDAPPPDEGTEDTSHPLIKPYQPPYPAYESQDYQNVSMFNPPAYVRLNNGLHSPKVYNDVNENYTPPAHDEDTTPSAWVPGESHSENTAGPVVNVENAASSQPPQRKSESEDNASNFSTALAVARNTELIQPPPVTLQLQTLNANEESTGDDDSDAYAHHSQTARNGTKFNIMNVNQIITIVKPRNMN